MTLPRWVDPDPPENDGDTGDAGETSADTMGWDDLSEKPVLEWTNEDWARWVDSPDLALPNRPPREPEPDEEIEHRDALAATHAEGEPPVESGGATEAAVEMVSVEPVAGEPESARAPADDPTPAWLRVLEEVAPVGAADVAGPVLIDPGSAIDDAGTGAVHEPVDLGDPADGTSEADEPVEAHVLVEEELVPTGEWFFGADQGLDEPDDGPVIVAGTFPTLRPVPEGEADPGTPWTDEEWAAVAEHPWWQSAPEPDPATAALVAVEPEPEVDVEVEVEVEVEVLAEPEPTPAPEPAVVPLALPSPVEALVPPAPLSPPSPVKTPAPAPSTTRATRPAPARRPVTPGPAVYIDETSHRIRSAFSLLGVAVMVGTVAAGLITIIVFAISLALRRAVG